MKITKEQLLASISKVVALKDYTSEDTLFSAKYGLQSSDWVYIVKQLAMDYNFTITDDFIDAMGGATFADLELLVEKHSR